MATIIAQINITMTDAGAISVEGAIDNVLFAYGLLECAKHAIKARAEEAQRRIQPATAAERLALSGIDGGKR